MEKVNEEIARRVLSKEDKESYTLIIDPTMIEANKRDVKMTYLGFRGYRPVVATLKEVCVVLSYEFKEGNVNGGRLDSVKKALSKLLRKKIKEVVLDSEYYSSEVIEHLEEEKIAWSIAGDEDSSIKELIKAISEEEWQPYVTKDG